MSQPSSQTWQAPSRGYVTFAALSAHSAVTACRDALSAHAHMRHRLPYCCCRNAVQQVGPASRRRVRVVLACMHTRQPGFYSTLGADALKSERAAAELDGVTFHPQITELARALCGADPEAPGTVWSRLSTSKRVQTLERLRDMKQQQEAAEVKECTFRPRIDPRSRAMMAERGDLLRSLKVRIQRRQRLAFSSSR
eukprot:365441-Chlamydomonas_euryale.AAC.2